MQEASRRSAPPATAAAEVLRALWREIFNDHTLLVAAGLAYYAIFGLLPALAAAAAVWGRFGDLDALKAQLQAGDAMLPAATMKMLAEFVTSVPKGFGGGLVLAANLLLVVWTAYRAAGGLLVALNIIYDVAEARGRVRRAVVALAIGLGGISFLFVALVVMAVSPLLVSWLPSSALPPVLWLRWPVMAAAFAVGLYLLFRYAPNRPPDVAIPACWGALVAALLWILASAGVSLYVAHIASFGKLYGSLGSFAVILLWLYVSALAVLTGAETDAVLASRRQAR